MFAGDTWASTALAAAYVTGLAKVDDPCTN